MPTQQAIHEHVVRNMRNELTLILFLVFATLTKSANATGQYPDAIVIDGKEYSIKGNPLEKYFEKYPEKKPKTNIMSSALHRGYIATFTFANEKLYLIDIKIKVKKENSDKNWETEMVSVFNKVFPNENKVLMDLYSGILIIHLNLEESYENRNRLLIEFENGVAQEKRTYGNKKYQNFLDVQFELYKKTDKYKNEFKELKKNDDGEEEYDDDFIEGIMRTYTPNFTSKFSD
ncbi:hypothetical protein [uncultured Psychroserpens sp.]|uniref:hypothetical protein n=1 Tax=uncultured Psychroserpens sp. TaxID=255436 RepID=UPI002633F10C|nr:hypothetical protein [uncultured Psychroserpens sp.]